MELVDRYLDGTLTAADSAAFTARAAENAELRQLIEDQRALREGLHRMALRGIVTRSAPSGGAGWLGPTIASVAVVAIATYAWLQWSGEPAERSTEQHAIEVHTEAEMPTESGAAADSTTSAPVRQQHTTVRTDTVVMVKRVYVPAQATEEERAAIVDSVRRSNQATEALASPARSIPLQNLLTPDADGRNDRLIIPGGPYRSASMVVRNAAGQVVFAADGPDPIWDGTLSSGRPAPDGTYLCQVYAVDAAGTAYGGEQSVRLVRNFNAE